VIRCLPGPDPLRRTRAGGWRPRAGNVVVGPLYRLVPGQRPQPPGSARPGQERRRPAGGSPAAPAG